MIGSSRALKCEMLHEGVILRSELVTDDLMNMGTSWGTRPAIFSGEYGGMAVGEWSAHDVMMIEVGLSI